MFKSIPRKNLWKHFFILSTCGPHLFLKTDKPSSQYKPILIFIYIYLKVDEVKICQQAHVLWYRPMPAIVTSNNPLSFLIHPC